MMNESPARPFVLRRMRDFTSQLGPVNLSLVEPRDYRPLVLAACSPAPNEAALCCTPPATSLSPPAPPSTSRKFLRSSTHPAGEPHSSISVPIDMRGPRVNTARESNRIQRHGQIADYDWAHSVRRYFLMTLALITLRPVVQGASRVGMECQQTRDAR